MHGVVQTVLHVFLYCTSTFHTRKRAFRYYINNKTDVGLSCVITVGVPVLSLLCPTYLVSKTQ